MQPDGIFQHSSLNHALRYNIHRKTGSETEDRRHYEIAVQLEPNGNGGSHYLHNEIHAGDIIESEPPKNDFAMVTKAGHSILIAGGIGITPVLSMLQKLAAEVQPFEIHYSAKRKTDLAFIDRLERFAGDKLHVYASREESRSRIDLPNPGIITSRYSCLRLWPKGNDSLGPKHCRKNGLASESDPL